MPIIDSDCHVIENEHTWSYMVDADEKYQPTTVMAPDGQGQERAYWNIEGRLQTRRTFDPARTGTAVESSDMVDVSARLSHMDELGVDVQVLYPTIFLNLSFNRPEVEAAMCRGYNRWMADIWKAAKGRLGWVVMAPTMDMNQALAELHFGKENGASGVFMRGMEQSRIPIDPYFFPLYEMSAEFDLPICLHSGVASFDVHEVYRQEPGFNKFKVTGVGCFHQLLWNHIPEQFPNTRWGFVELSAQWIPYALNDISLRMERRGEELPKDVLGDNNMFVACQVTDDLDYILAAVGDDNIVVGTDYGHNDTSTEIEALRRLRSDGKISSKSADKILDANAKRLYALN